jgi:leucyl/phenylalanyl-tRNA--protein transferase
MFTRRELGGANASKICLIALDARLSAGGFTLLDSQEANEHMQQFGGVELPFDDYSSLLEKALHQSAQW